MNKKEKNKKYILYFLFVFVCFEYLSLYYFFFFIYYEYHSVCCKENDMLISFLIKMKKLRKRVSCGEKEYSVLSFLVLSHCGIVFYFSLFLIVFNLFSFFVLKKKY